MSNYLSGSERRSEGHGMLLLDAVSDGRSRGLLIDCARSGVDGVTAGIEWILHRCTRREGGTTLPITIFYSQTEQHPSVFSQLLHVLEPYKSESAIDSLKS